MDLIGLHKKTQSNLNLKIGEVKAQASFTVYFLVI